MNIWEKKNFFYSKINLIIYFKILSKNNIVKLRLMIIIILNKNRKIFSDYFWKINEKKKNHILSDVN